MSKGMDFDEKFLLWSVAIYVIYMASVITYTYLLHAGD